jgi:hypothetical protein
LRHVALILALGLTASAARAEDAPKRAYPVAAGYVVTEPAWLFTDEGKARVDAQLAADAAKLAAIEKENTCLRALPTLTPEGAALLVLAGIVLGASATTAVALVAKR